MASECILGMYEHTKSDSRFIRKLSAQVWGLRRRRIFGFWTFHAEIWNMQRLRYEKTSVWVLAALASSCFDANFTPKTCLLNHSWATSPSFCALKTEPNANPAASQGLIHKVRVRHGVSGVIHCLRSGLRVPKGPSNSIVYTLGGPNTYIKYLLL